MNSQIVPVAPTELWLANMLPAVYSKRNHVVVKCV